MTKKIGKKSVKGVNSTDQTKVIDDTATVSGVNSVKPTSGISPVERASTTKASRLTRTMTLAEREYLFNLINEEAGKMVNSGELSEKRRDIVTGAVKMAIDSALLDDEEQQRPIKKK